VIQFVVKDSVKKINRSLILKEILQSGPCTKIELSEKFNLTFQTVGNVIKELEDADLIENVGYGKSSGGRPPILYNMNWSSVYVISLAIEVEQITVGIVDLKGTVIDEELIMINSTNFIESVIELIDRVINHSNINQEKIAGIGVSAPGPLDLVDGKVLTPPNLKGIANIDIQKKLEEKYNIPVVLERDANAFALAEQWFNKSELNENILYVYNDQGLGGGMIINSRIHRGIGNSAGEIGHMVIDIDGPRCNCGNFGCLEALSSGIAIRRKVEEGIKRGFNSSLNEYYLKNDRVPSIDMIIEHANEDDELANSVLKEAERYLGLGITNVMNLFSPDKIVFGGSVIALYPEMIEAVELIAKQRAFSPSSQQTRFIKSKFINHSNVIGGAAVIQQVLFDNPEAIINEKSG